MHTALKGKKDGQTFHVTPEPNGGCTTLGIQILGTYIILKSKCREVLLNIENTVTF